MRWDNQAWEVNLGDHGAVCDHRAPGVGERFGKQTPGQQRSIGEDRVGNLSGRDFGQPPKKIVNTTIVKRLDDRPGGTQGGLFIATLTSRQIRK